MTNTKTITGPMLEPVTVADAKNHLHVSQNDISHDKKIHDLIRGAREEWELDVSVCLIERTLEDSIPCWATSHLLSGCPVQEIVSVTYTLPDGTEEVLDDAEYYLDGNYIRFMRGSNRPSLTDRTDAIRVRYVAGYGPAPEHCPQLDKDAILLAVGNRFEDRDDTFGAGRKAYIALANKKMRGIYP